MPRRAALLALIGVWGIGVAAARGATFTVDNANDSGTGSLRKAVTDANASSDASSTINFSLPANSTIVLASELPSIESTTLILDATGSPGLTIDGGGTSFLANTGTATALRLNNVSYTNGSTSFLSYALTLDESGSGVIDGGMTADSLTLTKTGAGTTTLTAGNTIDLTGLFDVSEAHIEQGEFDVDGALNVATLLVEPAGTLVVDGSVAASNLLQSQGPLIVNGNLSAATLLIGPTGSLVGDTGSVTAASTVQGRVAPSGTSGQISFVGPLHFESGSLLDVDVESGGGDRLDVTGAVTIDPGARVTFLTNPSDFLAPENVTLIASDSPITGSFVLGTDYAFLDESVVTAGNQVQLSLAPNGLTYSSFARTPNQRRVAEHLDAASAGAMGDLADALDAINRTTSAEISPLLDAIGGESLTAFATARQILAERTSRALHRRVRDPVWGSGRAVYESAPTETPDVAAEGEDEHEPEVARPRLMHPGAWLDGFGVFGELDGDTGEAEVDTLLYGGTLGADATIADHFVVGLAAGYARSDVELDGRDADLFGDTIQGALYAGYVDPRGYLSAYGRYAYTFEDSSREIESSTLSRRAHARFDAQDYGAGAELGVTVVSFSSFALQPIIGVDWLRMDEESYTERGAGSLGLVVDPETLESTTTRFGGRLFGRLDMGETGTLVPELRAFYQQLSGDRERVLEARLAGAPGLGSIGVRGAELPRDNVLLGLGWGVVVGGGLTVSIDYDALLGNDRVEHQGTIAARVLF